MFVCRFCSNRAPAYALPVCRPDGTGRHAARSGSNYDPRNSQYIPAVIFSACLDLDQIPPWRDSFMDGHSLGNLPRHVKTHGFAVALSEKAGS
ncbi:MAG: hypothetical protein DRH37_05585 [Deltaproteobacteria bacterium]|nr:MAG: hypothetical protein DRH37_05585 [Deltaproteobacteria bacterium]